MSDNANKVADADQMRNEIYICVDGWLGVFHLLPPAQLGLQIALLSRRFDFLVDEHFKTRRWALGFVRIGNKIGANDTTELTVKNSRAKTLPLPDKALPNKIIGFKSIMIRCCEQNALVAFLHHFRPLFDANGTVLAIQTWNDGILEFAVRTIWPLLRHNIRSITFSYHSDLRSLRQFVPSFLSDYPSLRSIASFGGIFPAFPPDDSANACDGQAVAKWLSCPRPDGVPKMLRIDFFHINLWEARIDGLKTAFANASSSPAQFIIILYFWIKYFDLSTAVLSFNLINNLTGERLTLARIDNGTFLLVRCPLVRDEPKWANWEREAKEWRIDGQMNTIVIGENEQEQEEESEDDGLDFGNLFNTG